MITNLISISANVNAAMINVNLIDLIRTEALYLTESPAESVHSAFSLLKREIESGGELLRRDKKTLLAPPPESHFRVKWLEKSLIYY